MRQDRGVDLLHDLIPYVPPLVVRKISNSSYKADHAVADVHLAAVLFVDIKGFSEIAENLALRGTEGAEELASILNNCFKQLIAVIDDHGGEVTKFAGDALLAIWPLPPDVSRIGNKAREILSDRVLEATQCALAIQEIAPKMAIARERGAVLQIGIAAGDIYSVHLGGILDRWEFLLSGDPLVQMSLAKDHALAGQVVLSPEAWQLVHDRCSGEIIRSRFVRVTSIVSSPKAVGSDKIGSTGEMIQAMKAYVPAAITHKVEAGFGRWLAEFRYITVLFVKLAGYGTSITHPFATTLPEAQAVMRAMQTALYKFEGSINKFNVDDKGINLVAAMGLPPLSHEDDERRAISAALEMQETLRALDRPCAIGVATGWVYCGPIGSEIRREYTVVGNSVNRAARLMQAADSKRSREGLQSYILCDEATYTGVTGRKGRHGRLSFERFHGVTLKGGKTPLKAHRPSWLAKKTFKSTKPVSVTRSIVGRDEERKLLQEHLRALAGEESFSRVLVIEGVQGIGKSAILKTFLEDSRSMRITTHIGRGREADQLQPYHAWRPIFTELFGIDGRLDDVGSQRRKVMRRLPILPGEKGFPALALRLTPLLNHVLGLEFAENRTTKTMPEDIRGQTTRLFLIRLLQHSTAIRGGRAGAPRIIVLENAQWLDEDSWRLAITANNLIRPLLLVIITRQLIRDGSGIRPPSACWELLGENNVTRLKVGQLPFTNVKQLLDQKMGDNQPSGKLHRTLWDQVGGNPLLVDLMIQSWIDNGLIRGSGGSGLSAVPRKELERAPLPAAIQKIVTGRFDRLPPTEQLVLKAASQLPGKFSILDLKSLVERIDPAIELDQHLRTIADLDFLVLDDAVSPLACQFPDKATHQVVRQLLPTEVRAAFQPTAFKAS